jgi:hypothetical protein
LFPLTHNWYALRGFSVASDNIFSLSFIYYHLFKYQCLLCP